MLEIELLVRYSILLVLIFLNIIIGQNHPDSKIDSLLKIGINDIILQDYDMAKKQFTVLNQLHPHNPLGNI